MTSQPQRHYSLDDYFDGQIFAMAGPSVAHNDIAANLLASLRVSLRGTGCRAFGSDLRIVRYRTVGAVAA